MKLNINKKHYNKRIIIITVIVIALAVVSYGTYRYLHSNKFNNKVQTEQIQKTSAVKQSQVQSGSNNATLPTKEPSTSAPDKPLDTDTNSQSVEAPNILRADYSNGAIKVVATFQNASSDTCILTLTRNTSTLQRTTNIAIGPSYYDCSFNVPKSELGSSGTWTASVTHVSGNLRNTSPTQTIEVQ